MDGSSFFLSASQPKVTEVRIWLLCLTEEEEEECSGARCVVRLLSLYVNLMPF